MPLLKKGAIVGSDVSGECYQVTTGRIAEGGFGEIYRGVLLDGRRDPVHDVAIKVLTNPLSWHGEAYFGRLLENHERVVRLLDAFQMASGSGAARLTKYLLGLRVDGRRHRLGLPRSRQGPSLRDSRGSPDRRDPRTAATTFAEASLTETSRREMCSSATASWCWATSESRSRALTMARSTWALARPQSSHRLTPAAGRGHLPMTSISSH